MTQNQTLLLPRAYWFLALFRIILVVWPQSGYIHPDEHFQSVEVLAAKFLNVEATTPWEFNASFPVRSMALPYFTIGMSIKMLRDVDNLVMKYLSATITTPYYLLIVPRLLMCFLSFIVDYCLYKICVNNNEKGRSRLVLLATSYVVIIFGTRTFSNTLELILFSVLLYYVSESMTYSNMFIKKREYLNYRYENSEDPAERARFYKLRMYLKSDSMRNAFKISTITVLGFFNRPTFFAFAIIPIFFWLYRGIGLRSVVSLMFYLRMFTLAIMAVPAIIFVITIDSFYYGYISWGEIGMLDVSLNSFVFTPLNFLKYSLDTKNLAQHGLHPRYLHALINVPLLFNVLALCVFGKLFNYVHQIILCKFHLLPTVRSIKGLMYLTFLTSILLLSIFPHQEPRFLIPLIVPLIYLYGPTILPEVDDTVIKATSEVRSTNAKDTRPTCLYLKLWLLANLFFVIFYGFVHQGGVFKATAYLSNELNVHPNTELHIVTSHIYSLPQCYLLQKSSKQIYSTGNSKYILKKKFFLYEEGSKKLKLTVKKIKIMFLSIDKQKRTRKNKAYRVYLLIPSSLNNELEKAVALEDLSMVKRESFFPHLSVEAFPKMTDYCLDVYNIYGNKECYKNHTLSLSSYVSTFFQHCGLDIFEFSLNTVSTNF